MDAETLKSLVDFFFPLLEGALLDEKGAVKQIFNPFMTQKEGETLGAIGSSHEVLGDGRFVKQLIQPLPLGFLRLRYDTSQLHQLKAQLEALLQMAPPNQVVDEWRMSVDRLIAEYLKSHQITLQAATGKHKRHIIAVLHAKKLFDFKEASSYIAAKLQLSRATVYNYLKTIGTLQSVKIHQVDAFTDKKFGGNPAGVVLDADGLDEAAMRKIARELNLSETSFVCSSQKADFRLRYFTPSGHEVNFCGHSTVGALFVLAHEKRFEIGSSGTFQFKVETLSGLLEMEATVSDEENIEVSYQPPKPNLCSTAFTQKVIAKAGGIPEELIAEAHPILLDETCHVLFVPSPSLDCLGKLECDFKSLGAFCKEHNVVTVCFLTRLDNHSIHMRCFAPAVGVNEDPFTGSALGGLTVYAHRAHWLPKSEGTFRVIQGQFMERPGFVDVSFREHKGHYEIQVCAKAVHCFSTEINL